ncbi:MAG: FimV/HubP family polar landmark protein [Mariprofundales bacterium]
MKVRWLKLGLVTLVAMMQPALVGAVSLGRIDVASHLGEPFFAVAPLSLDDGESLSSIFVDLATPVEYRFLEVYREDAVSTLRTAIKQDARGVHVELSSVDAIQSPFINLVLRVRFGRATHFKKFAVFLALPKSEVPDLASKQDVATTSASPSTLSAKAVPIPAKVSKSSGFTPFSDWARTNRYGPMVYGDTVLTVARRLRVDKRYSVHQVAVAIFNKNRDKFSNNNINLVKAGSYLETPTAAEVAALTPAQATHQMHRQARQWKAMTAKNMQYAQLAKAQKNRYSKRVRVGAKADGRSASGRKVSTSTLPATPKPEVVALTKKVSTEMTPSATIPDDAAQKKVSAASVKDQPAGEMSTQAQQRISSLKSDNELLQATITATNTRVSELEAKLAAVASNQDAETRIKQLEARLMRMQRQLSQKDQGGQAELLQWVLYGAIAVIVLLLVVIGVVLRRQPQHPAQQVATTEQVSAVPTASEEEAPVLTVAESESEAPMEVLEKAGIEPSTDAEPEDESTLPEADVDYLAEADVYLRYGMESEAEEQVRLALEQRPDDPLAHAKLVEVRRARGDQAGIDEACSAALAVLGAEAVALFHQQIGEGDAARDGLAPEAAESADAPAEEGRTEAALADVDQVPSGVDNAITDAQSTMHEEVATASDAVEDMLALNATPGDMASDTDDDLEALLASSGMDTTQESDDEDDVLDLSADGEDDDLDALIASLEVSSDEPALELEPEPLETESAGEDGIRTATSQDAFEELVTTSADPLAEEEAEVVVEPIAAADDAALSVETNIASAESEDADALDFDLSGVDMSKADNKESLVNSDAEPESGDLDFALDGMDLSGIELPGSTHKPEIERDPGLEDDSPLASVTEASMDAMPLDKPLGESEPSFIDEAPVEESTVNLDLELPSAAMDASSDMPADGVDTTVTEPLEQPQEMVSSSPDLDLDISLPVEEGEEVATPSETAEGSSPPSDSDAISLDMEDLDMLLAEEEVGDADSSEASHQDLVDNEVDTVKKESEETKSSPVADGNDEMRTLLDGLDDLDFSTGESSKS